jgi:hypothetical protein
LSLRSAAAGLSAAAHFRKEIPMSRLRTSLLLLALVALAVSAAPACAGTAPPASPLNLCAAPAASTAIGTPAPSLKIFPPPDYIQCGCKLCEEKPDVICQISPSGYSIVCSDWYRLNC